MPDEDDLRAALHAGEGDGGGIDADRLIGRALGARHTRRVRVATVAASVVVVAAVGSGIGAIASNNGGGGTASSTAEGAAAGSATSVGSAASAAAAPQAARGTPRAAGSSAAPGGAGADSAGGRGPSAPTVPTAGGGTITLWTATAVPCPTATPSAPAAGTAPVPSAGGRGVPPVAGAVLRDAVGCVRLLDRLATFDSPWHAQAQRVSGQWVVDVTFTAEQGAVVARATKAAVGRPMAILAGSTLLSAATVVDPITAGRGLQMVVGSEADARRVAAALGP